MQARRSPHIMLPVGLLVLGGGLFAMSGTNILSGPMMGILGLLGLLMIPAGIVAFVMRYTRDPLLIAGVIALCLLALGALFYASLISGIEHSRIPIGP